MTAKVYVFDAYGTLFDVHSAVRQHADALGPAGARMSQLWRAKQLEYSWVNTLMGTYEDFWQLTEQALDFALDANDLGRGTGHIRTLLLESYLTLDAYPEVPSVIKRLRDSGARVGILSNGSPEMLNSAIGSAKMTDMFDNVISVDSIKKFKTAPEVYQMVLDQFETTPDDVSFQSSNRWDIAGAQKFGFQTVWINRFEQPDEYKRFSPDRVISSLKSL